MPDELLDSLTENPIGISDIDPWREDVMVSTIESYRRVSLGPIIVILGAVHTRNIQKYKLLKDKNFDYAIVNQATVSD